MIVTIPCVCPPTTAGAPRHEADEITLRDRLNFRQGLTVRNTIIVIRSQDSDASIAEILAALTEVYLLEGVESWTLVDQRNKAVPADREHIRAFMEAHPNEAMDVGNAADDLYVEQVMRPLLNRVSTSSPLTPMDGSTSATTGSVPTRRKRSKPSSISTSPTDDTMPMSASPGGVYS